MYIYNLEKCVSPAEMRSTFLYPYENKTNPGSSIICFDFEHRYPREMRRSDNFSVIYIAEVNDTRSQISSAIETHDDDPQERGEQQESLFGPVSFDFSYDYQRMAHNFSGCRPERFEDAAKRWIEYYKDIIGLNIGELKGPCVVHYGVDGEFIEAPSS